MLIQIGIILLTALLSSALTLSIAYALYKLSWKKEIMDELDEYADVVKVRVKEAAIEAGNELLPDFREQVREGFKEAMSDSLKGELIERSARDMARSGTDFVESGLNLLLGKSLQNKPGDSKK